MEATAPDRRERLRAALGRTLRSPRKLARMVLASAFMLWALWFGWVLFSQVWFGGAPLDAYWLAAELPPGVLGLFMAIDGVVALARADLGIGALLPHAKRKARIEGYSRLALGASFYSIYFLRYIIRPFPFILLLVGALALIIGTGLPLFDVRSHPQQRQVDTEQHVENAEAPPPEGEVDMRPRLSRRTLVLGFATLAIGGAGLARFALMLPGLLARYTYRGHKDHVSAVAWSPDGTRIASGDWNGSVQIWDATTGGHIARCSGHGDTVIAVTWSPDGRRVASSAEDNTVRVWDSASGRPVWVQPARLSIVAWSPDGQWLAMTRDDDNTIHLLNPATGDTRVTFIQSSEMSALTWSPDSQKLAIGGYDGTVAIREVPTGRQLASYQVHSTTVSALAWSPDGRYLATGSDDKTAAVLRADTGRRISTYRGHGDTVNAVAWSPDASRLASASDDETVQVWSAATAARAYTWYGHANFVEAVVWSSNGSLIASGSWDTTVQVWQPDAPDL